MLHECCSLSITTHAGWYVVLSYGCQLSMLSTELLSGIAYSAQS